MSRSFHIFDAEHSKNADRPSCHGDDPREHDFTIQPANGCFSFNRRRAPDDFPVPGSLLHTRHPGWGAKGLTLFFSHFPFQPEMLYIAYIFLYNLKRSQA